MKYNVTCANTDSRLSRSISALRFPSISTRPLLLYHVTLKMIILINMWLKSQICVCFIPLNRGKILNNDKSIIFAKGKIFITIEQGGPELVC